MILGSFFLALAASMISQSIATAVEPGDLDTAFGRDGIRYIDLDGAENAQSVSVVGAESLRLGGRWEPSPRSAGPYQLAAAQVLSDGQLDGTFSSDGKALINPTAARYDPVAEWAPCDHSAIVALGAQGRSEGYYLARIDAGGSLDQFFGDNGVVSFSVSGRFSLALDVLCLRGGRVLVVASNDNGSVVYAFRRDGSRVRGFGSNGRSRVPGTVGEVLSLRTGKSVLIVGTRNEYSKLGLHAIRRSGEIDTSFGRNGRGGMGVDGGSDGVVVGDATVLGNGDIAVTGETLTGFESDAFIARFLATGQRDRGFGGGDGSRQLSLGNIDGAAAITGLPDERLVIAGTVAQDRFGDSPSSDLFLAAFKSSGQLWKRFGSGGIVRTDFGRPDDAVSASDVAVVGGRLFVAGGAMSDLLLARYFIAAN